MAAEKAPVTAEKKTVTEVRVLEPKPINVMLIGLVLAIAVMNLAVPWFVQHFAVSGLLLAVTAGLIVFVRTLPKNLVKLPIYMLLGFAVYWNVGSTYAVGLAAVSGGTVRVDPSPLSAPADVAGYATVAILALANAVAMIIAMNDHPKRATMFGVMGFAVAIFGLAKGTLGGRPDIVVLVALVWTLQTLLVARSFGGMRSTKATHGDRVKGAVKSSIIGLVFYALIVVVYLVALQVSAGLTIPDAFAAIAKKPSDAGFLIGSVAWRYALFHIIILSIFALVYGVVLHVLNIERKLLKSDELLFVKRVEAVKAAAPKKAADPYKELLEQVRKLRKELEKVDRLDAAQLINRHKSEFDVLTAKHGVVGSKAELEKLLKEIEGEFEKRYG